MVTLTFAGDESGDAKRSKSQPQIQIADLIAGAILRRGSTGAMDAYDFIAGKLTRVVEFGTLTNPPR